VQQINGEHGKGNDHFQTRFHAPLIPLLQVAAIIIPQRKRDRGSVVSGIGDQVGGAADMRAITGARQG
jgi:hypothetical protein